MWELTLGKARQWAQDYAIRCVDKIENSTYIIFYSLRYFYLILGNIFEGSLIQTALYYYLATLKKTTSDILYIQIVIYDTYLFHEKYYLLRALCHILLLLFLHVIPHNINFLKSIDKSKEFRK